MHQPRDLPSIYFIITKFCVPFRMGISQICLLPHDKWYRHTSFWEEDNSSARTRNNRRLLTPKKEKTAEGYFSFSITKKLGSPIKSVEPDPTISHCLYWPNYDTWLASKISALYWTSIQQLGPTRRWYLQLRQQPPIYVEN